MKRNGNQQASWLSLVEKLPPESRVLLCEIVRGLGKMDQYRQRQSEIQALPRPTYEEALEMVRLDQEAAQCQARCMETLSKILLEILPSAESHPEQVWQIITPLIAHEPAKRDPPRKREQPGLRLALRFAVVCAVVISIGSVSLISFARPVREAVVSVFEGQHADVNQNDFRDMRLMGHYIPNVYDEYSVLDVQSASDTLYVLYIDEITGKTLEYWFQASSETVKIDNENAVTENITLYGRPAQRITWADGYTEIHGIYNDGIDDVGFFRIRCALSAEDIEEIAQSIHLEGGKAT